MSDLVVLHFRMMAARPMMLTIEQVILRLASFSPEVEGETKCDEDR